MRRKTKLLSTILALTLIALGTDLFFGWCVSYLCPRHPPEAWRIAAFENDAFAKQILRESRDDYAFRSTINFRSRPFHSELVNIDSKGRRHTDNPTTFSGKPIRVFVFGGSTLWGYGARDNNTIPSYLSRALNANESRFEVTNYGERAYYSLQELFQLIDLLERGEIPDYVIFYDGANDLYVSFDNANAEQMYLYGLARHLIEQKGNTVDFLKTAVDNLVHHYSGSYRFLQQIGILSPHRRPDGYVHTPLGLYLNDVQYKDLKSQILSGYHSTQQVVAQLAQAYGFDYHFFWQPLVFTSKNLSAHEKIDPLWKWEKLVKLTNEVNQSLDKNTPTFTNISNALDNKSSSEIAFLDWCHLREEANKTIADRMLKEVRVDVE